MKNLDFNIKTILDDREYNRYYVCCNGISDLLGDLGIYIPLDFIDNLGEPFPAHLIPIISGLDLEECNEILEEHNTECITYELDDLDSNVNELTILVYRTHEEASKMARTIIDMFNK